jgi:hypothetical protein
VGSESLDQLVDAVRRLARADPLEPLDTLLGGIADAQIAVFDYLDRRHPSSTPAICTSSRVCCVVRCRKPRTTSAHPTTRQARPAYACADNAGHDGLGAWARGLQSLVCYWSGRLAAEAIAPVLDLPEGRRIHGIVTSVEYLHDLLLAASHGDVPQAVQLSEAMREFSEQRLVIPQ